MDSVQFTLLPVVTQTTWSDHLANSVSLCFFGLQSCG
ncbi:hypothetical protein M758_UG223900 [Ceratodon purpureus]|uniref:Uncharacterized protein n=1 Tax=Ceratodon purpureus TaxID=3225 RepID=A0A8T0GHS2_CERPU|nr:hypothetical protein KC19_10G007700 [Ceratodon purpureus]KAG0596094.1 hypothetical protein M758_UG223900 [Ceratodon purpureus]